MKLLIVMTVLMMSLAKIKSDEDLSPCGIETRDDPGTRKRPGYTLTHDLNLAQEAKESLKSIIKHKSEVGSDEVKKTGGGHESLASMKDSFCDKIFVSQKFLKNFEVKNLEVEKWKNFGCFSVDDKDLEKLSVLCKFS